MTSTSSKIVSAVLACALLSCQPGCQATESKPAPPAATPPPPVASQGSPAAEPSAASTTAPPTTPIGLLPTADRGVFDDLAGRVETRLPSWLAVGPLAVLEQPDGDRSLLLADGVPVAFTKDASAEQLAHAVVVRGQLGDTDEDGFPDALDIALGAEKTALNRARYVSIYHKLSFPGGDVPRDEGVCTDVVIRALRNAGFDLQELLSDDLERHPERYPHIKKPDPNIDQRRVRGLLPWFQHHFEALPKDAVSSGVPHLPGDVVFFDTMRGPEPDHLGIVSQRTSKAGVPLVINNWTDGSVTSAMDLLSLVPVTHRFRVPNAEIVPAASESGLQALLRRHGLSVPRQTKQVVLVTSALWSASAGRLRRFERSGGDFAAVGESVPVRLGTHGLGRGRGLHDAAAFAGISDKREGDRRAPAGVFTLGYVFGPSRPGGLSMPWQSIATGDVFVDDPNSVAYNQLRKANEPVTWSSAEDLTMYELALLVRHNQEPVLPGAGSAIFLHTSDLSRPTAGCTGLRRPALAELLSWLSPEAKPVLVQLAGHVY